MQKDIEDMNRNELKQYLRELEAALPEAEAKTEAMTANQLRERWESRTHRPNSEFPGWIMGEIALVKQVLGI